MEEEGRGGGVQAQGVNPDCPNAANPFHRRAEYCPVAAPVVKPLPGRAAQNGSAARGDGELQPAGQGQGGVNPDCPNAANPFHRCAEYCPVAAPAVKPPPPLPPSPAPQNGSAHSDDGEQQPRARRRDRGGGSGGLPLYVFLREGSGGDGKKVDPRCPNAANPFHRCAEYCPVAAPAVKPPPPPPLPPSPAAQNGSAHSDDSEQQPRTRRRDRGGGSGGLPLYVFLREGSDGDGKKVDPRCPNAANPFHVCTDHCLAKMADAGRSSDGGGGKSPISLFSRHSRRSSSSSEDGSVKSAGSKKADPKYPNAGGEYCTAKMKEVEKQKVTDKKSLRKKGKEIAAMPNWKVDPRCPNAGNPFHICAQYCFDHLNEAAPKAASKPDSGKGKSVMEAEQTGEINPNCVKASNPYHKCGEYCKRNGNSR